MTKQRTKGLQIVICGEQT